MLLAAMSNTRDYRVTTVAENLDQVVTIRQFVWVYHRYPLSNDGGVARIVTILVPPCRRYRQVYPGLLGLVLLLNQRPDCFHRLLCIYAHYPWDDRDLHVNRLDHS